MRLPRPLVALLLSYAWLSFPDFLVRPHQDLHAAVAASGNPTLPIFQGSFRNPDKASLVGDLSALFDYGNLNSFPDGTLPDWQLDGW